MSQKSYAEILADFVVSLELGKIPVNVVEHAKLCILDWLGATIAGTSEKEALALVELFKGFKPEEATIIGFGVKIPSHDAAYVNGAISHMIELDDIHREAIIHPGVPVVPAALALSEKLEASGKVLVESVIAGYEVEIAIGKAINPSHYKYWHSTGTCGTFGAAAAACKVLGLDAEKIVNAFGIAGTHAAGLIEVFGTSSKPLNPGRAARDGVIAALLAERGFTGPRTILEGDKGFFKATSTERDYDKGFKELGTAYEITRNGFKRHSSCGHTHAAIDAILSLKNKLGLTPQDIVEIEVGTYSDAFEIVGKNYEPKTPAEAKFSLPYCIAVALLDGAVSLRQFTHERVVKSDVRDLARKVKVYVDDEVNALYPRKLGAKVRVRMKNGDIHEELVEVAKGNPENPLSKDELIDKFIQLASMKLSADKCKELIEAVMKLEKLSDARELLEIMVS
ncbi:MAG: MmgE/PrpD family protein [Candidatus Nezhaarchaeales archaeon]